VGITDNLAFGFAVALTAENLLFCLAGALLGTLIGVLPGIGPVATVAMLLPLTFSLPAIGALIMLAGIYYGAQYGGSTTAILVRLPGEASAVMTSLDGYQMARQGRAGPALAIAAIGSFCAGTVGTAVVALAGPPLTVFARQFGSAEYFALMVVGLVAAVVLASGSVLRAIAMVFLGVLLGSVGNDLNSGVARFTFGIPELADGIGFVPIAVGLFGIAEILKNLESPAHRAKADRAVTNLLPSAEDLRCSSSAIVRGTGIGLVLGALPGGGALLSAFAAYMLEKRVAKEPRRFGEGDIRGVAAPESANNAAAQTSFIPMLSLGIPPNAVMALMIGAMIVHGIQPGPQVMTARPDLFWGLIASMWIGNAMLFVINLPLIGVWVKLLSIPYRLLFPAILLFCCIGVYTLNGSAFEVGLAALFGALGYLFLKLDCEPAPLILGFVLGPMMEEHLRRALILSRGDIATFVERPIAATLLALATVMLVASVMPALRRARENAAKQ
jgi:TctA family transporter